ncbi:MAG: 4Fe-4S binding protein [Solobacterium sp.]|nr:4Fe-4S binding protein [Solobacterium sp.]
MKSEYIRLVDSHCHNCLRCVRACPTNAMTYLHNEPRIEANDCILCGRCYAACPHDAKSQKSEFKQVLAWLKNGEEVILSAAPSFAVIWENIGALKNLLIRRGFKDVEETAQGAAMVSRAYIKLMEENTMKNIITTCCPAINTLIEKEYPDLIDQMAPVVSPMIAHGRMIKKNHPDARVVFLSPCIAKYKEIEDARFAGAIDACVSMQEIVQWVKDDLKEEEQSEWSEFEGSISRVYPTAGGVIRTLPDNDNYEFLPVDGIERVRVMLESIRSGELEGCLLEVNSCRGACLAGPLLSHFTHAEFAGQRRINKVARDLPRVTDGELPVDMKAVWKDDSSHHPKHSEEEIRKQMIAMGKTSPMKIHDCGACGYETCRLKAIAVLDGKADPKVCLPEALEAAQSLSNVVLDNTPNAIIVVDNELRIRDMNRSGKKILGFDMVNPSGMPLEGILPNDALLDTIRNVGRKTAYFHCYYDMYDKLFEHAIVNVPNQNLKVIILMDRTQETLQEIAMANMRTQTIEVTQQVINEQMRTVQEIASMLGETTAKSKVALLKLQKVINGEENL